MQMLQTMLKWQIELSSRRHKFCQSQDHVSVDGANCHSSGMKYEMHIYRVLLYILS